MTRTQELHRMSQEARTASAARLAEIATAAGITAYGRTAAQRRESVVRQLRQAVSLRTVAGI